MSELEKTLRDQLAEKTERLEYWRSRAVTTEAELANLRLQYISDFGQVQDKKFAPTPPSADHIPDATKMVERQHHSEQPLEMAEQPYSSPSAEQKCKTCEKLLTPENDCGGDCRDCVKEFEQPDSSESEKNYLRLPQNGQECFIGDRMVGEFVGIKPKSESFVVLKDGEFRCFHPRQIDFEYSNQSLATNPQRITEQDAIAILDEYFAFGGSDYKKWLQTNHAKNLLNFLSENREPDYKVQRDEFEQDAKRYQWIRSNIKEQLTGGSAREHSLEHKTMYVLPQLIAWADFCGQISFDEAIDGEMSKASTEPQPQVVGTAHRGFDFVAITDDGQIIKPSEAEPTWAPVSTRMRRAGDIQIGGEVLPDIE